MIELVFWLAELVGLNVAFCNNTVVHHLHAISVGHVPQVVDESIAKPSRMPYGTQSCYPLLQPSVQRLIIEARSQGVLASCL